MRQPVSLPALLPSGHQERGQVPAHPVAAIVAVGIRPAARVVGEALAARRQIAPRVVEIARYHRVTRVGQVCHVAMGIVHVVVAWRARRVGANLDADRRAPPVGKDAGYQYVCAAS